MLDVRSTLQLQFYDSRVIFFAHRAARGMIPLNVRIVWENVVTLSLLLAGALLAQPAVPVTVEAPSANRVDVAYDELVAGRPREAVRRIEGSRLERERDPSAMINLGTAYARLGNHDRAVQCYRAAIASTARYDLELADGSWMDSRRAARVAIRQLARGETLALR